MLKYPGLKKRPTYNELINYLGEHQEKIKYPNRDATFIRNSPYLSQFDGDSVLDLQEQENAITKGKLMEETVKKLATEHKETASAIRASRTFSRTPSIAPSIVASAVPGSHESDFDGDSESDFHIDYITEAQEEKTWAKRAKEAFAKRVSSVGLATQSFLPAWLRPKETYAYTIPDSEAEEEPEQIPQHTKLLTYKIKQEVEEQSPPRPHVQIGGSSSSGAVLHLPPTEVQTHPLKKIVEIDNETSREYWNKKTIPYIKEQIALRGITFSMKSTLHKAEHVQAIMDEVKFGKWIK